MDEMRMPNQNIQSTPPPQPVGVPQPKGKAFWTAIGAVVLMVIIAVIFIVLKPGSGSIANRTPEEELAALRDSSQAVTTSQRQQAKQLQVLSEQSKVVTATREDRLKELEALNQ